MLRWLLPALLMLSGAAQAQQLVAPVEVKDCGSQYVKQIAATGLVTCAAAPAVPGLASAGWIATANPDQIVVFTASQSMTVTDIRGTVVNPVGSTAAVSVYKTSTAIPCVGGTNLVASSGTFNANGTANSNQSLTLAGSGAPSLVAGDRVCLSTSNGSAFTAGTGNGTITITYTVP